MTYFSWFVIRLITPEVSNYLITNSSQNSAQRISYQSKEKAVAFQLSYPVFCRFSWLLGLFQSYVRCTGCRQMICHRYFSFHSLRLPWVTEKKLKWTKLSSCFRLMFAVLKRLLSSKLQYSVMFLEPEYLYSTILSLFFSLVLTRIEDKKIF